MAIKHRPFTRFRNSTKGVSSGYNKQIVNLIFKSIEQILKNSEKHSLTVEAIYPVVEKQLDASHIAVLKNDLIDMIIEILNFLIENGDVEIYENFFDDIESELKKAIWPAVSRLNDPEILDLLIDEIFNELDNASEYTADKLADRFSQNDSLSRLTYSELLDVSERALIKLEDMNFLVG